MSADDKTRIVSADAVQPGTQLNGIYEIDSRIAAGGMGEVYRGHNIQTGDPVAIKIVLPEFARDQNILALFRKEASILNHLSHDAIVRYHVFSIDPGIARPYLAMEFVDGPSLADWIEARGPLDPQEARKMLGRIAAGLALAHQAGIIHRDVSPDNIILQGGRVERAKLIDFGIARSANIGGGTLLGGKFAGKYNFVSPEQLGLFGGEVTERSDIYSLGLVLAAALRGVPLDMSGSQVEVIEKRRTVPDLLGIDPGLQPLLDAMLQPDPDARPQSAQEIVDWLRLTSGRSVPPDFDGDYPAETGGERSPAMPRVTGLPPRASFPSQHPFGAGAPQSGSYPRSSPPGSLPPASYPPYQPADSLPGAVESPFGPGPAGTGLPRQGEAGGTAAHASLPPRAPTTGRMTGGKGGSRGGLIAALAVVLIIAAGGAVWYSGVLDGILGRKQVVTGNGAAGPKAESGTGGATGTEGAPVAGHGNAGTASGTGSSSDAAGGAQQQAVAGGSTAAGNHPAKTLAPADWVHAYDGGPCFYAAVTSASGNAVTVEGYGASRAAFFKMVGAYKADYGVEPTVNIHKIADKQCAVADFLRAVEPAMVDNPTIALSSDTLKVGEFLSGTVGGVGDRTVNLLLIGSEGDVYSLDALWKKRKTDGGKSVFGMKLFPLTGDAMPKPLPHLIMVLTSPKGLASAAITDTVLASSLFPKIAEEFKDQDGNAGVAVGYFHFGG